MWRVMLTAFCLIVSITLVGCTKPPVTADKKDKGGAVAGGVEVKAAKEKTEIEAGKDESIDLTITPKDKEVTLTVNDTKDKKVTGTTAEKTKDGTAKLKIAVDAAAKEGDKVTVTVTGKEGDKTGSGSVEVTVGKKK